MSIKLILLAVFSCLVYAEGYLFYPRKLPCSFRPCAINANCLNNGYFSICTCKPGYSGDGRRECKKMCRRPFVPTNGRIVPDKDYYEQGDYFRYYCNDGYAAKGFFYSGSCGSYGIIRAFRLPVCLKKDCNRPYAPYKGKISPKPNSYRWAWAAGYRVTYSCNAGYHLVGSTSATCQSSGQFYPPRPTCEKTCPKPDAPENGSLLNNKAVWMVDDVANFDCSDGYNLEGSSSIKCTSSGSFSPNPPTCNSTIVNEITLASSTVSSSTDVSLAEGSGTEAP